MRFLTASILLLQLLLSASLTTSLTVDATNAESLKQAAAAAAASAVNYYNTRDPSVRDIPGKFYNTWWEGGPFFQFLINYWHWTGDSQYNDLVNLGLVWQGGENNDFFPSNYSSYLGNDDQEFWALAAMSAIEQEYPDVPGKPSWLSLAQGAFNDFAARWEVDDASCGGGLRWQLTAVQPGYSSKNAISNAGFFQLAARLGRYTTNQTYLEWAEKVWNWSTTTPLLNNETWYIADMTPTDTQWKAGVDGLLGSLFSTFFPKQYGSNIISEVSCEPVKTCNRDQIIYKGLVTAWLSTVSQLASYTSGEIIPKLQGSAVAAGNQCSGPNGTCGITWFSPTWDGSNGIEQEMSALSVFANTLVAFPSGSSAGSPSDPAPVTSNSGGNSTSNPDGGQAAGGLQVPKQIVITTGDRVGAALVTTVFGGAWIGMIVWLVIG